jgi:hypothetical protein
MALGRHGRLAQPHVPIVWNHERPPSGALYFTIVTELSQIGGLTVLLQSMILEI